MKNRSKSLFVLVFVLVPILVVNIACGLSAAATETPTPTDTPLPTSTNTPRPTATATPNLRATQAAEMEQAIRSVLTDLELDAETGSVGWIQDDPISIDMEGSAWYFNTFAEDVTAGDFVISTDMTWETDSWPVCGLYFRANSDITDFYAVQFLRFSGLPAWDFEYYQDDQWISTLTGDIKFSDYLSIDNGATNQFTVAAIGNEFKLYINGHFEGRYYDWSSKLSEGGFSFVGSQSSGDTTCTFDNTWLWIYK